MDEEAEVTPAGVIARRDLTKPSGTDVVPPHFTEGLCGR
jgi:hypothetical protein